LQQADKETKKHLEAEYLLKQKNWNKVHEIFQRRGKLKLSWHEDPEKKTENI